MPSSEILQKLATARQVVTDPRLRTLAGKKKMLVEEGNVYGERIGAEAFDRFLDKVYADEAMRRVLLAALRETPLSIGALAERTGLHPQAVFRHLLVLQQKGQVELARVEDDTPLYRNTQQ